MAAALTFFTFLPALQNDWVNWDDPDNFLQNPAYRGLGMAQVKWMWSWRPDGSGSDHYIPLSWMTLGLDYKLWGMNPFGYHLTNVLIHTATAALVYFLAIAIFEIAIPASDFSRVRLGALSASLLFAIHPLRVESVAWITERRDVLSGFFWLLAALAYVRAYDPRRPARRRYYWLALLCFALALLSKEIAITLPAVLLVLDVYPLRRLDASPRRWFLSSNRRVWLEKIPFAALSILLLGAMWSVSSGKPHFDAMAGLGWLTRVEATVYNLAFYLRKTLVPVHLSPFYSFTPGKVDPLLPPFEISVLVVLSVSAAAVILWRRMPALAATWVVYIVILSPVLGLVPTGPRLANDRNTYLACLGWALLAGAGVIIAFESKRPGRRLVPALAALAILCLAVLTHQQISIWHDSEALWTRALDVEPSFLAYNNMADVLAVRGDDLWAIDHFRQAIAMRPDFPPAHIGLGGCLLRLNRAAEAIHEFETAMRLGGDAAIAHNGLACALAIQGNLDEAIRHFDQAIQLRPSYEDARRNRAQVLARRNASTSGSSARGEKY